MNELVFLLEERSMQEVLQVIVPPLVPSHITCRFIPHEGKKDLEKSIPRKPAHVADRRRSICRCSG